MSSVNLQRSVQDIYDKYKHLFINNRSFNSFLIILIHNLDSRKTILSGYENIIANHLLDILQDGNYTDATLIKTKTFLEGLKEK